MSERAMRRNTSFNSRPHKEVDVLLLEFFNSFNPFNSRPHKEVDEWQHDVSPFRDLSIHDLTRRSTLCLPCSTSYIYFFQFTTSQGGRQSNCYFNTWSQISFNSRPHKEVDWDNPLISDYEHCLSIHDLTRRSTAPNVTLTVTTAVFQFTTSQGGRRSV